MSFVKCAICQETKEIDVMHRTNCDHHFCRDEISRCDQCPLCRRNLAVSTNVGIALEFIAGCAPEERIAALATLDIIIARTKDSDDISDWLYVYSKLQKPGADELVNLIINQTVFLHTARYSPVYIWQFAAPQVSGRVFTAKTSLARICTESANGGGFWSRYIELDLFVRKRFMISRVTEVVNSPEMKMHANHLHAMRAEIESYRADNLQKILEGNLSRRRARVMRLTATVSYCDQLAAMMQQAHATQTYARVLAAPIPDEVMDMAETDTTSQFIMSMLIMANTFPTSPNST